jgi:hypothetical protein
MIGRSRVSLSRKVKTYSLVYGPNRRRVSTNVIEITTLCPAMSSMSNTPIERLWKEYSLIFQDCDDLTLARWMAQTLGQLQGQVCRLSHPLLGTYRLAAQLAYDRQIWLKRLANPPGAYQESGCCRAPLLPLLTRDVLDSGLVCQHCGCTAVPFDELPEDIRSTLKIWGDEYAPIHAVAHWDENQRNSVADYNKAYENASAEASRLLLAASKEIVPKLLEHFPAIVWEDQDECLEVRPEDIGN